jgi:hypothetical protein
VRSKRQHPLRRLAPAAVGTAASAPRLILTGLLEEEGLPANWLSLVDITQSGLAAAYSHGEEGILGTKSYISGHAGVDKAVCAAIAMADNYLLRIRRARPLPWQAASLASAPH